MAQGPVMIGIEAKPDDPKVGRVLGGARIKKDDALPAPDQGEPPERPDRHTACRRSSTSGSTQREGVNKNGMATAKTDRTWS